jgi:hypothetical protein
MTSNLPVVGLSGQFAGLVRASREVGGAGKLGGAGALDFASVLAEVRAARAEPPAIHAQRANGPTPAATAEVLARALIVDAPMQRLAAPLVYRAIDAYRELMNVSA